MATQEEVEAYKAFFRKPKVERDAILAEAAKDPRWKNDPFLKQLKKASDLQGEGTDPDYID